MLKLSQDSGVSPFKLAEQIVLANQGDVESAKELMKVMALHDGTINGLKAGAVALDKKDLFQIRIQKLGTLPSVDVLRGSIAKLNSIIPPGQATSVEGANKKCEERNSKGTSAYVTSLAFMSKGDAFLDNLKIIYEFINQ